MEIDVNNEKENIKLLLFAVNNIFYLENKSTETIKMNMRGHKESKSNIPK